MLPHERSLVKRLQSQPFALIGINSDPAKDLKEILKKQEITWRQAVDGSTSGPLATKWNVHGWPTIYVIDAKGVIRYKDVRDDDMNKAVDTLLTEIQPGK
jgi:peroxiredoxin